MAEPLEIEGVDFARYELPDIEALQALNAGTADAHQQKRALKWIIENACATYGWAFKDDERETNIALGRQFSGQQIVGALKLKLSDLRRKENE
jgi:hypothetical protein